MSVLGYPALNISATSGWLPSGNHLWTALTAYIPNHSRRQKPAGLDADLRGVRAVSRSTAVR
jgi:hypothetical protein